MLPLIMGSYLERAKQLNTLNMAQMLQPRSLAALPSWSIPGYFTRHDEKEPMKIGGTYYYKAFVSGLCKGMSPHISTKYGQQYGTVPPL